MKLYSDYDVHGRGLDDLWTGLNSIGIPTYRHQPAVDAVRKILDANAVTDSDFCWYKVPHTDELAAYWPGARKNQLWVGRGSVGAIVGLVFPLTVTSHNVHGMPMHHFPGVIPGTVGPRKGTSKPAVEFCQECFNPHGPDEDHY